MGWEAFKSSLVHNSAAIIPKIKSVIANAWQILTKILMHMLCAIMIHLYQYALVTARAKKQVLHQLIYS